MKGYLFFKRFFDFILAIISTVVLLIPIMIISILVKLTSRGPILYWSDRIGINNTIFKMPKFRTMRTDTPEVATHLLTNGQSYLTPIGGFLRKTSMDEFPQLLTILKGDMSFVGPRPALYNQNDLRDMRTEKGVHQLRPGLTGYAQIMGRDEIGLEEKVEYDLFYLKNKSLNFDLKILLKTILKVLRSDNISH